MYKFQRFREHFAQRRTFYAEANKESAWIQSGLERDQQVCVAFFARLQEVQPVQTRTREF